jgi:hypothetical protein
MRWVSDGYLATGNRLVVGADDMDDLVSALGG